jgi:flavin-dependent dehydrogenase
MFLEFIQSSYERSPSEHLFHSFFVFGRNHQSRLRNLEQEKPDMGKADLEIKKLQEDQRSLKLLDGSRVAVIGGGPAGTFFTIFLLDMAERAGEEISVDIYEPRNFLKPGPAGCNMCAGIVSETLVQMLAAEGINLPGSVVQRGIDSYTLHMDVGSVRIDTPLNEKRIAAVYRGAGPRDLKEIKYIGLDNHLLNLALERGAMLINERVNEMTLVDGYPQVKTRNSEGQIYDLVAVTTGVNSSFLKMFENLDIGYTAPETTKTYLREYYLGREIVTKTLGNAIQVFLLDIPRLEFGMIIPKGDYMTVCLLGKEIDTELAQAFLNSPEVQKCLPPTLVAKDFSCHCSPRINTLGAKHPYGDRFVFIGDAAATRLFKDGIGSAYRTAKIAASTAIFQGVSAHDFATYYLPACQKVEYDNDIGRLIFWAVTKIQKLRFARRGMLRMILNEQSQPGSIRRMSTVQWDMYTGSGSYKEIFMRILNPAFLLQLSWDMLSSIFKKNSDPPQSSQFTAEEKEMTGVTRSKLGKFYQPGDTLIRQGEIGDSMLVIQEGQVVLMREQDGEEVFLGVRSSGEVLGENAIFEKEVHTATVRALSDVRVVTVDKENFNLRIHEDPSLGYRLFNLSSRRIRELSQQVTMLNQEIDRLTQTSHD